MKIGKGLSSYSTLVSGKAPKNSNPPVSGNQNMSGYLTFRDVNHSDTPVPSSWLAFLKLLQ
jgi:hypothetical protein